MILKEQLPGGRARVPTKKVRVHGEVRNRLSYAGRLSACGLGLLRNAVVT